MKVKNLDCFYTRDVNGLGDSDHLIWCGWKGNDSETFSFRVHGQPYYWQSSTESCKDRGDGLVLAGERQTKVGKEWMATSLRHIVEV